MDIKLKDKKFSLKVVLLMLSICISTTVCTSIYIKSSLEKDDIFNSAIAGEINSVYSSVVDLSLYTEGLNCGLKEDSIQSEVKNIKDKVEKYKSGDEPLVVESMYLDMNDDEIRQAVISRFIDYTNERLETIERNSNIEFYYSTPDLVRPFTNVHGHSKETFENDTVNNYKDYIIIKSGKWKSTSKNFLGIRRMLDFCNQDTDCDIYVRIAQPLQEGDLVYDAVNSYNSRQLERRIVLGVIIGINIACLLLFIVMLKKKKYKAFKEDKITKLMDNLYVEFKVIAALIAGYTIVFFIRKLEKPVGLISISIIGAGFIYLLLLEGVRVKKLTSDRKIKDIVLNKSVIRMGINYLKEKNMWIKIIFLVASITVIFISWFIFMAISGGDIRIGCLGGAVVGLLFITAVLRYLKSLKEIADGSMKIAQGEYNCKINVTSSETLKQIAANLENIQDGLKNAVNKAVKSEKMKGELITNVSHDLKTPLTSIISYVDLLSQENITEEQRKKYLEVLNEKSNRLKVLIEDLFEVSKASSGNVELNMENLDPVSLLRQTLGELEDKIEKSNLKIIKKFPEEKLIVYADGRKTFRIFQNLLSNIFKYSMEGSRVYIEVENEEKFINITFKNTSKEELNFTEEEIMQRFKRGDLSRSTEGSGLGLAIAKSLTEVQKGEFDIKLDGDLFKVMVKLKKEKNSI